MTSKSHIAQEAQTVLTHSLDDLIMLPIPIMTNRSLPSLNISLSPQTCLQLTCKHKCANQCASEQCQYLILLDWRALMIQNWTLRPQYGSKVWRMKTSIMILKSRFYMARD